MRSLLAILAAAALLTAVVAYGPELPFLEETPEPEAAPLVWEEPPVGPDDAVAPVAEAAPLAGDATELPGAAPEAPAAPRLPEDGLRQVRGTIRHSLHATLAEALPSEVAEPLGQVVKRALVWWLDPRRDLRPGDLLEVVYEPVPGEEPRLHAVRFTSGKHGRTFEAFSFQAPDAPWPHLYDADGQEVESRLVDGPIARYEQITSLVNDGRRHHGVDFKAPVGEPVVAPFAGTVARKNWNTRRNGWCLDLHGPGGVQALFLHLDGMPDWVRPGATVKAGQVIASSGNTGRSTAPHLHYELRKGGRILDPFEYHRTRHGRLDPAHQAAFEAEVSALRGRLDALAAAEGATGRSS